MKSYIPFSCACPLMFVWRSSDGARHHQDRHDAEPNCVYPERASVHYVTTASNGSVTTQVPLPETKKQSWMSIGGEKVSVIPAFPRDALIY